MKKIGLTIGLILGLCLPATINQARAESQQINCVITGYYSPLPGQNRYVTGSFDGDRRLNGNGTNGADGTPVYQGMIAAPKSVAMGTKIEIPGYGIGTVHDRGGAIITYHDPETNNPVYRFDIWLGKGDEGLARALQVGVRQTTCTLHGITPSLTDSITFNPVQVLPAVNLSSSTTKKTLSLGDTGEDVQELQASLQELGFFSSELTANFEEQTLEALIQFQIEKEIIDNANSYGAGIFGPQTQRALAKQLAIIEEKKKNVQYEVEENSFIVAAGMGKNTTGQDVLILQQILKQYNYYDAEINGIYDQNTIEAVLKFQKDQGVIQNESEVGAGYFGPKTNQALIKLLNSGLTLPRQKIEFALSRYSPTTDLPFELPEPLPPESILQIGIQSEEVRRWQKLLIHLGYLKSDPTGLFGPLTQEAVFRFQKDVALVQDWDSAGAGMIGPKTSQAIVEMAVGN